MGVVDDIKGLSAQSLNNLPVIHDKLVLSNNTFPFDLFAFQMCEGFIPKRISRPAAKLELPLRGRQDTTQIPWRFSRLGGSKNVFTEVLSTRK
jgi:hypothetical protein